MHKARLAIAAAATIGVAITTACGSAAGSPPNSTGPSGTTATGTTTDAGTLSLGLAMGNASFNPWLAPAGDNEYLQVEGAVYDSLTHVAPDGSVTPALATSWKFTDPTTLMVTLRSDVKFDDGTPLDAAAVKANFDYAKKATPAAQRNGYIAALTTTVVNPTTLKLVASTPEPDLPTDFATGAGFIVNPKALANPDALKTKPDGTGPYVLDQAVPGQQYTFTRRKDYWDAGNYPYSKLVLKNFSASQAQDNAMKSGQIQGAPETPTLVQADLAAGLTLQKSEPVGFTGIWLADRAGKVIPALGKEKVRQALNYALDRDAIMKAVWGPLGKPGSLVIAPGMSGYSQSADAKYDYDPAKAKQLLAEAGYPNGFTLPILSTPAADTLIQAIVGYLRKVGVNAQIKDHTADYISQAYSGKWGAIVFTWTSIPPAQALNELLSPTGLGNFNHSTDPQIDQALDATQQVTGDAQTQALEQLVTTVNDKAWFLLPGYNPVLYVTGKDVTCQIGQRPVCLLYTFRPAK